LHEVVPSWAGAWTKRAPFAAQATPWYKPLVQLLNLPVV